MCTRQILHCTFAGICRRCSERHKTTYTTKVNIESDVGDFFKLAAHLQASDDEISNSLPDTCISEADEVTVRGQVMKYWIKHNMLKKTIVLCMIYQNNLVSSQNFRPLSPLMELITGYHQHTIGIS